MWSHIAEGCLPQTGGGLRPQVEGDVGAAPWEAGSCSAGCRLMQLSRQNVSPPCTEAGEAAGWPWEGT